MEQLGQEVCLRDSLFEVRFVTTQTLQAIVLLLYHKPLTDTWTEAAAALADKLNVKVVGRSRKQKIVTGSHSTYIHVHTISLYMVISYHRFGFERQ
jgi:tRNA (uracil-5-)-methyltransferase